MEINSDEDLWEYIATLGNEINKLKERTKKLEGVLLSDKLQRTNKEPHFA